ncbi:MAG: tRNA uracil 4-sulfurtransferase ThiI, partial [Enterococcus sp.]
DTFQIAIQPFEDCCTIFAPPQPKTRPKLDKVLELEERFDIEGLMARCLAGIKIEEITPEKTEKAKEFADFL